MDTLYTDESQFDFEDLADLEELLNGTSLPSLANQPDGEDLLGLDVRDLLRAFESFLR